MDLEELCLHVQLYLATMKLRVIKVIVKLIPVFCFIEAYGLSASVRVIVGQA